jgi:hypothetical protein
MFYFGTLSAYKRLCFYCRRCADVAQTINCTTDLFFTVLVNGGPESQDRSTFSGAVQSGLPKGTSKRLVNNITVTSILVSSYVQLNLAFLSTAYSSFSGFSPSADCITLDRASDTASDISCFRSDTEPIDSQGRAPARMCCVGQDLNIERGNGMWAKLCRPLLWSVQFFLLSHQAPAPSYMISSSSLISQSTSHSGFACLRWNRTNPMDIYRLASVSVNHLIRVEVKVGANLTKVLALPLPYTSAYSQGDFSLNTFVYGDNQFRMALTSMVDNIDYRFVQDRFAADAPSAVTNSVPVVSKTTNGAA